MPRLYDESLNSLLTEFGQDILDHLEDVLSHNVTSSTSNFIVNDLADFINQEIAEKSYK